MRCTRRAPEWHSVTHLRPRPFPVPHSHPPHPPHPLPSALLPPHPPPRPVCLRLLKALHLDSLFGRTLLGALTSPREHTALVSCVRAGARGEGGVPAVFNTGLVTTSYALRHVHVPFVLWVPGNSYHCALPLAATSSTGVVGARSCPACVGRVVGWHHRRVTPAPPLAPSLPTTVHEVPGAQENDHRHNS